jgi:hypothetical protein
VPATDVLDTTVNYPGVSVTAEIAIIGTASVTLSEGLDFEFREGSRLLEQVRLLKY